jgi:hypothetical protein
VGAGVIFFLREGTGLIRPDNRSTFFTHRCAYCISGQTLLETPGAVAPMPAITAKKISHIGGFFLSAMKTIDIGFPPSSFPGIQFRENGKRVNTMLMTKFRKVGYMLPGLLCAGILIYLMILPVGAHTNTPDQYDYYVSFHMQANSLTPNYAYDLVTLGDQSGGEKWVYNIYLFGTDSSGLDGRIQVWGMNESFTQISPTSYRLEPGTDYFIVWRYSGSEGGELFINNISQGEAVKGGGVNGALSSAFHIGENMYSSGGRQHSKFDGSIRDLHLYVKNPSSGNNMNNRLVLEKNSHATVPEKRIFAINSRELAALEDFMDKYSTRPKERQRILGLLPTL